MWRRLRWLLIFMLALGAAFGVARWWLGERLEAQLLARADDRPVPVLAPDPAVVERAVEFRSGAETLRGRHTSPAGAPSRAGVFIAHGGQGERYEDWREAQRLLARAGYDSFSFDYAGFAGSTGATTIESLPRDTRAAWAHYVASLPEHHPVFLMGLSLGCGQLLATLDAYGDRPRGIVLFSCFSSVRDFLHDADFLREPWNLLVPDLFDNVARAPGVPFPVLQVHGDRDETVSLERARKLHQAFPPGARLEVVRGMRHNDPFQTTTAAIWRPVLRFMAEPR